jgi:hypothetical protein
MTSDRDCRFDDGPKRGDDTFLRPPSDSVEIALYSQRGEHDRQVRFDRVPSAVEDRAGMNPEWWTR